MKIAFQYDATRPFGDNFLRSLQEGADSGELFDAVRVADQANTPSFSDTTGIPTWLIGDGVTIWVVLGIAGALILAGLVASWFRHYGAETMAGPRFPLWWGLMMIGIMVGGWLLG